MLPVRLDMRARSQRGGMSRKKPNNVRALREELLLSKAELARRAGVSALTVDRIEGGANCRVDTKRKIILALGKKVDQKHEVFPEFGTPGTPSEGEES